MSEANIHTGPDEVEFTDIIALLKPRVMSLVVFTALVGMIVAPVGVNPVIGFAAVLFIALGAGASGALNMWWDADIDAIMQRTAKRPVPSGRVSAQTALIVGLWMSALAVAMLGLTANWVAAGWLAFTIFFYAVIYSMWLKRSTPQNIVIGGAAGAFPPMIGWAVATGSVGLEAWAMFALIFFWTPPHFWALALFMKDDYTKAGVPMLTVTHGRAETRRQIWLYTLVLTPVALLPAFMSIGGPIYLIVALGLSVKFLLGAWEIRNRDEDAALADDYAREKSVFRFSLVHLFTLFAALLVERVAGAFGLFDNWPVIF